MVDKGFILVGRSLALLLLGLLVYLPAAFSKEPEDIWAELARLSAGERQKQLLSGARSEGKVVFYTNLPADHLERLRQDFENRFQVTLEGWRASGEKTANRFLTEGRAAKFAADLVTPSNEHLVSLIRAGLVGLYNSPERSFYSEPNKDREGYWTSHDNNMAIIAYNTKLVRAAEAPRKYEDFLDPKWKGNFALDMDPDKALMGWLKTWGEEKTRKFLQGLIKNDLAVRKGHTLAAQLLCAGEFKAAMDLYIYRVADLKHAKGCPVEIIYPDPIPGAVGPLAVAKRAPHPYGAALLTDYILSDAGQKLLSSLGRISGRRGIKPKYPDMDFEGKGVRVLLLTPEDSEKLEKKYQQLREEFLLKP
jgi:iron(III) transport system substrate-binding protein